MSTQAASNKTQHSPSEYFLAYGVYVLIFVAFISVCTIAIITTSAQEANKTGFRAITTKTPTSFIDRTYMAPEKKTPEASPSN